MEKLSLAKFDAYTEYSMFSVLVSNALQQADGK